MQALHRAIIDHLPEVTVANPAGLSKRRSTVPSTYSGLPANHPARPVGEVFDLGDGVWLEPRRLVTPELAAEWLKFNIDNRTSATRIVSGYSRNIAEGVFNDRQGDPIRFALTGKLLDGQQRLQGVVDADTPVHFVVVTGLPESAQETMDTGRRRTVADQLKIQGVRSPEVVSSSARLLWLWDHGSLLSNIPTPTNPEILEYVLKRTNLPKGEPCLEDSAVVASRVIRIIRRQSVSAALHYRMSLADQEKALEFWGLVETGAIPDPRSPILALRETLRNRMVERTLTRQSDWLYLVSRAWWLWRRGLNVSRLQFPKGGLSMEAFPVID